MFRNRYIRFIAALLFMSSVAFIVFNVYNSQRNRVPSVNNGVEVKPFRFQEIQPGETTKEDVVKKLGEPVKSTGGTNLETLLYNSTSKTRDDNIVVENGIVVLIKEVVSYKDPKRVSDITNLYGLSTYSFFGPDSAGGNKLYVYPDKGIAYIGKPKLDALEEIWYFAPTSIENFKQKWAPNYSETQIPNPY